MEKLLEDGINEIGLGPQGMGGKYSVMGVNIENTAAAIESQLGSAVVESVFKRYGAHGTWDLRSSDLPDVFSELYAIEADLD